MPAPIELARVDPVMSGRTAAQTTGFMETIHIAFEAKELPDDRRHEPPAASAIRRAEIVEVARLDPTRTEFSPAPRPPERRVLGGPIGSLLFHLLPLLALVTWLRPPLEIPPPIPIQLVVEQPPPPPPAPAPPKPKPESKPPPPGLHASEDMGEVGPPKPEKGAEAEPPAQGEPQPPAPAVEAKPAAAAPEPPPKLTQLAEVPVPPPLPPKPAPPKREAAVRLPKPDGLILPLPIYPDQHPASHSARVPGPTASRDEYCAYALTLALQHLDLLPSSVLGARHGDTAVAIVLRSDGSISSVRVVRGSNYEDIDERVVQMVWAVGRFPPLPSWIPGSIAEFTFHLHFPNPASR